MNQTEDVGGRGIGNGCQIDPRTSEQLKCVVVAVLRLVTTGASARVLAVDGVVVRGLERWCCGSLEGTFQLRLISSPVYGLIEGAVLRLVVNTFWDFVWAVDRPVLRLVYVVVLRLVASGLRNMEGRC